MSDIKHLTCLSVVKSMGAVRQLTPAAFPGNHCPMHTALSLGVRIEGLSTLVIGTAECGYYSRNVASSSPYAGQGIHWTYLLGDKEVVFGCREGLRETIREMDEAGAKAILLLVTCVPELIGEDVESLCREVQPEVSAKLVFVPLGNFMCGGYQPGYWKTLLALGGLVRDDKGATRTVNILGRAACEDHIPLPRIVALLEDLRMPLRFLAPNASLDDFIAAGDSCLNIVLSPFMEPLAERIKREHGIPFVSLHNLYDVTKIDAAYLRIGALLGVKMPPGCDGLRSQAMDLQKEAARMLEGLQYISANIGALQALPLSVYLASMGMSPIMVHMEEFYPSDTRWRQTLLDHEENPIICLMVNEQVDRAIIEALCPDVVIGDWGGRGCSRPPTIQVLDLYGQVGYERTITLLERMMKAALSVKEKFAHGIA